jgi:hypothetical protein
MYSALLNSGGKVVRYTEYPGVGHNSWNNVGNETTLYPWLFAQQLESVHGYPESATNFSVQLNDENYPLLNWNAPEDQSNEDKYIWAYRIYRNGEQYKTLNNDILTYSDVDTEPDSEYTYSVAAMNYYFHEAPLSKEIAIKTEYTSLIDYISASSYDIKIYPNPVINKLNISLKMKSGTNAKLYIVNTSGQEMAALLNQTLLPGDYIFNWNVSHLSKGVYSLVIQTNERIEAIPFIISH